MSPTSTTADVQEALDRCQQVAWGDLDVAAFEQLTCIVQSTRDHAQMTRCVVVVLEFRAWARVIHGHRYNLPARVFTGRSRQIDDIDLVRAQDQLMPFMEGFREACSNLRGGVYEYDPRIGTRWTKDGPPSCPLFDPPLRFPPRWKVPPPPTFPNPESVPCPFCREFFDPNHPPMWGGGNVGWVHADCWTDGLPLDNPLHGSLLNTMT